MTPKTTFVSYFRNFIFGVEDSLVSTVGLLSGIATAEVSRDTIFLAGIVLIFVEAFSMAAGSFLSESSAEGYLKGSDEWSKKSLIAGTVMFFSYFVSGFIPLFPYLLWPVASALPVSVTLSLIALFALGVAGAKISGTSLAKNSFRMVLVGGIAIALGMLAGTLLSDIKL